MVAVIDLRNQQDWFQTKNIFKEWPRLLFKERKMKKADMSEKLFSILNLQMDEYIEQCMYVEATSKITCCLFFLFM